MLNNAGKKIVLWSRILLYVGVAASVIVGIWLVWRGAQANTVHFTYYHMGYLYNSGFAGGGRMVICGFLVIIFGSLVSWLWALLMRAFGDLAVDTKAIRERLECAYDEMNDDDAEAVKAEAAAQAKAEKPAAPKAKKSVKAKAEEPTEAENEKPAAE
jgi:hypothetical protein